MGSSIILISKTPFSPFQQTITNPSFPSNSKNSTATKSIFTVNCRNRNGVSSDQNQILSSSSAYHLLGVDSTCSAAELKSAFRAKVKEFHPDVRTDGSNSDVMIRLVIQAYEILSNSRRSDVIESALLPKFPNHAHHSRFSCRECLDPFDEPECEAIDIFVNESLCVGRGCSYACVERAPHAFRFSSTGTARATSQGHGDDYQVQLAVGQCPRNCIHYVTPSQRLILEELLDGILNVPYDNSAEADLLYSLIVKAKFENNRYRKPKREAKDSTEHVDWF